MYSFQRFSFLQILFDLILLRLTIILPFLQLAFVGVECRSVNAEMCLVWGPGLRPHEVVLPARYFYIMAVDSKGQMYNESPALPFVVEIQGHSTHGQCRTQRDVIDRGDGTFLVRYNLISDWCDKVQIHVKYNGTHVAHSPYYINEKVYSEKCHCPKDFRVYSLQQKCSLSVNMYEQIVSDLEPFQKVNFSRMRVDLIQQYNQPLSIALCHYVIKDQEIWSQCYGKYTGFRVFMDAILLALRRIVQLPDIEFFLNVGDWPLSKKRPFIHDSPKSEPYPIFSWCGNDNNYDIVLPTYDLTESTVENMGHVSLDILSAQRHQYPWSEKLDKLFWRGRDSRRERLDLIDLARKYPDDINASITNFFFFREEMEQYGPTEPYISFMEFFRYKYQLNIDGTVASYRLPYLLAGDGLVFKQDSPYYEHFYRHLVPYKHYVPVKRDLSDLIEKIKWARSNEALVHVIRQNARKLVENHLMPDHIYCYHLALFKEWNQRLISPVQVLPGMEKLQTTTMSCSCQHSQTMSNEKDEL